MWREKKEGIHPERRWHNGGWQRKRENERESEECGKRV